MSFEADLKQHLQADDVISALVADRIFPMIIPKGKAVPAITYTLVFGEPQNSLDGFTSNLRRITVQIDCWSQAHRTMLQLADAVVDRLNVVAANFRTVITEYPTLEDYEDETERYRRCIGASCWYTE